MNLPKVITELIKAQDNFDSEAYANCFSDTAVMFDEGKTHRGRIAIQQWIATGNQKYRPVMKPVAFTEIDNHGVLSAEISGTFDGSPIVLNYDFEINEGLIHSLKITS